VKGKNLALLILVCAVFAYFGLKEPESQKGKAVIKDSTPLKPLDLNSITEVTFEKGTNLITLKQLGEQWRATTSGNLDFPVNFQKFREFLLSIRDLELESRITRSKDHDEKFGLDTKSEPTVVSLISNGKKVATLNLGQNKEGVATPNSGMPFNFGAPPAGQYLHLNDDPSVYLIPKPVNANMTASAWMMESIAKANKDEMSSIEFHYPHKNFKLEKSINKIEKSTDGSAPPKEVITWNASGDLPSTKLDASKISDLLNNIDEIKANEPVHKDIAKSYEGKGYGLKVSRGENAIYEIKANYVGNDWYIANQATPDELYKISSFRLEDIFAKNQDLFQLKNISIADNITKIKFVEPTQSIELIKTKDQWSMLGHDPLPAIVPETIETLVRYLKSLDAQDYLVSNLPASKGTYLEITTNGKVTKIHDIGSVQLKSGKLIQIEGQALAYSLEEKKYDNLFPKLSKICNFKSSSDSVSKLKAISYNDFKLVHENDQWSFDNGDAVNEASITALWSSYEAIFESAYLPSGKLEEIKNSLVITHADDKIETINLGPAKNGLVKIQSSRFGGIFQLNLDIARSLINGRLSFAKAVDKTEPESN